MKRKRSETTPPVRRIDKVQFGLFSAKEIQALSAVQVTSAVINKAGVVQSHGVNDARMGTTDSSMLCSTCACTMEKCPGHSGHIVLAHPVVNIEFLGCIHKVLTCVCFFCCRLLLPKDHLHYAKIRSMKNKKQRLVEVYEICKKFRKCSSWKNQLVGQSCYESTLDDTDPGTEGCGAIQPVYLRHELTVSAKFRLSPEDVRLIQNQTPGFRLPTLTPAEMVQILQHVDPADYEFLGFQPGYSAPASMFWSNFLVPPVCMRPSKSRSSSKVSAEDDLTIKLRQIVKCSENAASLQVDLAEFVLSDDTPFRTLTEKDERAMEKYMELQRAVASYQDSKYSTAVKEAREYGTHRKSVRHRFTAETAKKGRVRNTILGKRMDFSARSVITPDSFIEIDEVGVPVWMCMHLTYPEKVNQYNVHRLTAAIRRGPDRYPGANYVLKEDGSEVSLKYIDPYMLELAYGWVVKRHLVQGDLVLFNRQPSLHKMSLMAHKVRPIEGNTFRLHIACTTPYNADYDGDEMNLSVLLDDLTRAEAQELVAVEKNIVKDTVPLICFQQHAVLAAYLLTAEEVVLDRDVAQQLLYQNQHLDPTRCPNGPSPVTGRQVVQACIPEGLCLRHGDVEIRNGMYLKGQLTKQSLNNGLVYTIWKDWGARRTVEFIGGFQRVLEAYLAVRGLSIGPGDCYVALPAHISQLVVKAENHVNQFVSHLPQAQGTASEAIEANVCLVMDKCRDLIGDYVMEKMAGRSNGLDVMVRSGAKGNKTNIIQTSGIVGQQRNHQCMRLPDVITGFLGHPAKAKAHGFITSSFIRGLNSHEYFAHLVGSRVGLVDTSVKTSETGYCQRKISKALEDVTVAVDRVVRDSHGNIIQFLYGQDGFDATALELNTIRFSRMSEKQIHEFYAEEAKDILFLQSQLVQSESSSLCPVNFDRQLTRAQGMGESSLNVESVQSQVKVLWSQLTTDDRFHTTVLFQCVFFDWCSTSELVTRRKLTQSALSWLLGQVKHLVLSNLATPYESIGLIASQNCSEPLTQMTLNRFHQSGQFSNLVTGVTRMKEIINANKQPSAPSMKLYCLPGTNPTAMGCQLLDSHVADIATHWSPVCPDLERDVLFKTKWRCWEKVNRQDIRFVTIHLDKAKAQGLCVTPLKVATALRDSPVFAKCSFDKNTYLSYSTERVDAWWVTFSCSQQDALWQEYTTSLEQKQVVQEELVSFLVYEQLIQQLLGGVADVGDFFVTDEEGVKVVNTKGTNLSGVMTHTGFDHTRTVSNSICEVQQLLGLDAACHCIQNELFSVMSMNQAHVGVRHIQLLANIMCFRGFLTPMTYQGIGQQETSVMKKAAFEKAIDSFVGGGLTGHRDSGNSVTESIAWNSQLKCGTGMVKLSYPPVSDRYSRGCWFAKRVVEYSPPSTKDLWKCFGGPATTKTVSETTSACQTTNAQVQFIASAKVNFRPSSPIYGSVYANFTSSEQEKFRPSSP